MHVHMYLKSNENTALGNCHARMRTTDLSMFSTCLPMFDGHYESSPCLSEVGGGESACDTPTGKSCFVFVFAFALRAVRACVCVCVCVCAHDIVHMCPTVASGAS